MKGLRCWSVDRRDLRGKREKPLVLGLQRDGMFGGMKRRLAGRIEVIDRYVHADDELSFHGFLFQSY